MSAEPRKSPRNGRAPARPLHPASSALVDKLRELAQKAQRSTAQPFLSVRQAAERLRAPPSSVARAYSKLADEGLLTLLRGAGTMVCGREAGRTFNTRGSVAIPIYDRHLLTLPEYRHCVFDLLDELRARGFAAFGVPFDQTRLAHDALLDKLRKIKAETVIWFVPDGANRDTQLRLRDRGIRFIGVNLAERSGAPFRYQVKRSGAIRDILRRWKQEARINRAVIIRAHHEQLLDRERADRLRDLLEGEQVGATFAQLPSGDLREFISGLCAGEDRRGILLPNPAAAALALYAPQDIGGVLASCSVALVDGALEVPITEEIADKRVDMVAIDPRAVAIRIAQDMLSGAAIRANDEPVIFEAKARLGVTLREISR